jgi:hypothetical protein
MAVAWTFGGVPLTVRTGFGVGVGVGVYGMGVGVVDRMPAEPSRRFPKGVIASMSVALAMQIASNNKITAKMRRLIEAYT